MTNILIPTRGRPDGFKRLKDSIENTCELHFLANVAYQEDDPKLSEYMEIHKGTPLGNIGLVNKTNRLANACRIFTEYDFMFLADDIVCETKGWDKIFQERVNELEKEHRHRLWILYGDDGIQGERLPTHPFMTKELFDVLTWFWPPQFKHLFTDNAIKYIGEQAGILRYVPEVKMTHHHFVKDKALLDDNYKQTNNTYEYQTAQQIFEMWKEVHAPKIIQKIKLNIKS